MFDNITIFYKDAEMHINKFNAEKAVKLLKKRIAEGEVTAQNYAFLANAYCEKNDNKKALKYAFMSKKLDPDYYYADALLAEIYISDEKFFKAERYLNNLLEKAPEDYYIADFLAAEVYRGQNNDGSKQKLIDKYCEKILSYEEDGSNCLRIAKCSAYLWKGDTKSALNQALKPLKADIRYLFDSGLIAALWSILFLYSFDLLKVWPSYNMCTNLNMIFYPKDKRYYELADPIFNNSSPEKLLKYIEKAIKIKPKPLYYIRMADIKSILGCHEEAIEIYKRVLEEDDSFIECYERIAGEYRDLDDFQNAVKYINMAILNNQEKAELYSAKAMYLAGLFKFDEALDLLLNFDKKHPEAENETAYYISYCYSYLEDYNKALLYINKHLLKEKTYNIYKYKMDLLLDLKRYEEAIETGKKALEFQENEYIYYKMAICHGRLEDFSTALVCINKSILLGGADKYGYYIKSEILSALGQNKEAEKSYTKAVELGYNQDD